MQERNAQMALKLHQMTGEPLTHCSYLIDQTNGDYETALKILERILQQRNGKAQDGTSADAASGTVSMPRQGQGPQTLEERVLQLEQQIAHLTLTLYTVNNQLTLLLDKLSSSDPASQQK
jgi:hypothetical protein